MESGLRNHRNRLFCQFRMIFYQLDQLFRCGKHVAVAVDVTADADHFGMLLIAGDEHRRARLRAFADDTMDFGHKRAGRILHLHPARRRLGVHVLAHTVRANDHPHALRHVGRRRYDLHAARRQVVYHLRIVDDRSERAYLFPCRQQIVDAVDRLAHAKAKAGS